MTPLRFFHVTCFVLWAIAIVVCIAGCSKALPPPAQPKPHTLQAELHCFIAETERGAGFVCTEMASACQTLQGLTAKAEGVTAISECRRADVTADAK